MHADALPAQRLEFPAPDSRAHAAAEANEMRGALTRENFCVRHQDRQSRCNKISSLPTNRRGASARVARREARDARLTSRTASALVDLLQRVDESVHRPLVAIDVR